MKNITPPFITLFVLGLILPLLQVAQAQSVRSPSGEIAIEFSQNPGLSYTVETGPALVLTESNIRIEMADSMILGQNTKIVSTSTSHKDEIWTPVVKGRRATIRDHYNEITLDCVEQPSWNSKKARAFQIVARAYDDGVAFKYAIPKPKSFLKNGIKEERTQFIFHGNPTCWAADFLNFKSHQEAPFEKKNIQDLPTNAFIGSPLLVKINKDIGYVAVTEAALIDSSAFYLQKAANQPLYFSAVETKLSRPLAQEIVTTSNETIESSWRVIMLAKKVEDFFQNDMILNLSEPCAIEDPSWIKPGMMAWDHWWSGGVKMNTETIKEYIQLAADMGWEYQLIDWQWYGAFNLSKANLTQINPDVDMDEVRKFAEEKGVKLWLWLYWKDVDRNDSYKKAFALYEKWGIAGIKIDFMQRDDQWMVNWYHKIVKAAADHHLMVDFHGAYKPTGWRRTYPNLMTREGVLGQEYSKWSDSVTPTHNCTILYTRNLLGELDYTPGGFLNRTADKFIAAQNEGGRSQVMGTRAHNLALFVLFESPLTVACDHPENYKGEVGVEFLKTVPTVWDETVCLDGKVGKYGVMAKQSGDDWFLGAITNEESRELEIDLDFLNQGTYEVTLWKDGPNANVDATDAERVTLKVTAGGSLQLQLANGGGAVAHFKKQ